MESLAALGVAAIIFLFIEYGYKVVGNVKKLRDLGTLDPDLEMDSQRCQAIVTSLLPGNRPVTKADLECLAAECVDMSKLLISEFESLRPKNPKSKWGVFKTVLKTEVKKSQVQSLESRLEKCQSQLGLEVRNTKADRLFSLIYLSKPPNPFHVFPSGYIFLLYFHKALVEGYHSSPSVCRLLDGLKGVLSEVHRNSEPLEQASRIDPESLVVRFCVTFGFAEYFQRSQEKQMSSHKPLAIYHTAALRGFGDFWVVIKAVYTQTQFFEVMNDFILLGLNMNALYYPSASSCFTLWELILFESLAGQLPPSWCPGKLVDWCLRHDADPGVVLYYDLGHLHDEYGPLRPVVRSEPDEYSPSNGPDEEEEYHVNQFLNWLGDTFLKLRTFLEKAVIEVLLESNSSLTNRLKNHTYVMTLRELLCYWFPYYTTHFEALLDWLRSDSQDENVCPQLLDGEQLELEQLFLMTPPLIQGTFKKTA
ncbi:hypothetical protein F5Y16DRAFT_395253 [Xylariaceae sp. FL0255]|nr:hypothetical protein F5Y16DRAFT_395253 [Xylariaceae sp. FL0255]